MEPVRTDILAPEYNLAFRSLKAAKNIFLVLILLCLLVQMATAVAINYFHILDPLYAKPHTPAATTQTTQATQAAVQALLQAGEDAGEAKMFEAYLHWILPLTKFVAFGIWLLLLLVLMFTVQLALVARTGGTAGFISAFLWALLLMVPLVPWQQVLHTTFLSGSLFNLEDMLSYVRSVKPSWGAAPPTVLDKIMFHIRLLGYPGVTILLLVVVQVKFLLGYNRMEGATPAETPKPPLA